MNELDVGFLPVLAALIIAAMASVATFVIRAARGEWIVGGGFFVLVCSLVYSWSRIGTLEFAAMALNEGWLWPFEGPEWVSAGVIADPVGLSASIATSLIVISFAVFKPEARRELGALGLSAAGVILTWISNTPWLGLVGVLVAISGGALSFVTRWTEERAASLAARHAKEGSRSLLVSAAGAAVMSSAGGGIVFVSSPEALGSDVLPGAILLSLGLLFGMGAFPLQGMVARDEGEGSAAQIVSTKVLPAFAIGAVLWRLHPAMGALGIDQPIAWLAAALAVLTAVSAFSQSDWRRGLSVWFSACAVMSVALHGFGGSWPALSILFASVFSVTTIAQIAQSIEQGGGSSARTHQQRAKIAKIGLAVALFAGTCGPGFLSAGAWVQSLAKSSEGVGEQAMVGGLLLALLLSGIRVVIAAARARDSAQIRANQWVSFSIPLLLAMGWVWSGSLSGGFIPGDTESVQLAALVSALYGAGVTQLDESTLPIAWGIIAGAVIAALIAATFLFRRGADPSERWRENRPRIWSAFAQSDWLDRAGEAIAKLVRASGSAIEFAVERLLWDKWMTTALSRALSLSAKAYCRIDLQITQRIPALSSRVIEVPVRFLQLIQSGDAQWYLFFAVGTALAILLNFIGVTL